MVPWNIRHTAALMLAAALVLTPLATCLAGTIAAEAGMACCAQHDRDCMPDDRPLKGMKMECCGVEQPRETQGPALKRDARPLCLATASPVTAVAADPITSAQVGWSHRLRFASVPPSHARSAPLYLLQSALLI